MLRVNNIQKNYGSLAVLTDVSFTLDRGQKVALVGSNGTGKTTLLKIIAGLDESDGGAIELNAGTCIGYLPQDTSLVEDESIAMYLRKVTGIDKLEERLEILAPHLNDSVKAREYSSVREEYERLSGYAFEHRMQLMVAGFGLENIGLDHRLPDLSSGQKSKVVLAGILLKGVDLLLLDEPTNNLDLPALIWLEDFLRKSEAACIVVSHDRRFLDRVVRKVLELDWHTHTLTVSGGTYSDYLEMQAKRLVRQKQDYRLQQEEVTRLSERAQQKRADAASGASFRGTDNDKFARGFKRDRASGSARTAKAIEKRIEQIERVERPVEREPFEIPLSAGKGSGSLDIRLIEVVAGYPEGFHIGPISLEVRYGNRIGILGLNGSGKSTLLRSLTAQLPVLGGGVDIGSSVRIGNLMQEHESLNRDQTLLGFVTERAGISRQESHAKLAKFGFDERKVKLAIRTLSPGERARLLLALFSAQSVNVLVLDEPTNHLDSDALDALEEALQTYQGTVLLVSHDRYFLEKTKLDFTYLLSDGALTKTPDYQTYVKQAEERAQKLLKSL